jgi:DNA-binding NtrC family response regulator
MAMNILVVDDEKDIQLLFEQRFRREICNSDVAFEFAYSGKEMISSPNRLASMISNKKSKHYHNG